MQTQDAESGDDEEEEEEPMKKKGKSSDIDDSIANGSCTVFIKNLPFRVTEDEMYEFFEACGEVISVRIATDRETGRAKGFGHVQFSSTQSAAKAIGKSGESIQGREVYIDSAEERGGGGGGGRGAGASSRKRLLPIIHDLILRQTIAQLLRCWQ